MCSILSISVASTVWTLIKHKVEFLEELGTADRGWGAEEGDSAPELACWGRWVGPLVWQSRLFTWSHWALITPKLGQVMARAGNISQVPVETRSARQWQVLIPAFLPTSAATRPFYISELPLASIIRQCVHPYTPAHLKTQCHTHICTCTRTHSTHLTTVLWVQCSKSQV